MLVTQVLELVRDGLSLSMIMDLGRQMLGRRQVIPGIAEMLEEVQVRLIKSSRCNSFLNLELKSFENA